MEIRNETDYQKAFKKIDGLVAANFERSESQQHEFLELAKAIQEYEKNIIHYTLSRRRELLINNSLIHHQQ